MKPTANLFDPLALRGLQLSNRIVVSPMCQYSALDGRTTDWHLVHWGQLLMSGAALFTIEATAVCAEGRITPGCLGLYDDACEEALTRTLARARALAPPMPVAMQIAHAGRKGSSRRPWEGGQLIPEEQGGWRPVAPSAIAYAPGDAPPAALDFDDLARIRDAFAHCARRAERAGIDALELHMAHGYLLHEFLSPLANRRSDRYGGSFGARARFPLEVFDAVRAAWPEARPLGVRLSCTDWVEGGWTLPESIELARLLTARGCDYIDASSGGVSPAQKIAPAPGYQVGFAREIRRATGAVTMAVGLISEAERAQAIVVSGDADLVAMARAFLWDPRWPWHAAAVLGAAVTPPPQYLRSAPPTATAVFGGARTGPRRRV
ncbi:MAG TPA: NADH:flavin oxidoreductase/NADH oxidase [Casimicrobiaceae bacterium]|nr:NADH:flavin oxidoreductase/NADH oxidase [Casimicrobiaceae bacterium]